MIMKIKTGKRRQAEFPMFYSLSVDDVTDGNITYQDKQELGLEKSHINDAFVIAGGNHQNRCSSY